jgi:hypothetical protein
MYAAVFFVTGATGRRRAAGIAAPAPLAVRPD